LIVFKRQVQVCVTYV